MSEWLTRSVGVCRAPACRRVGWRSNEQSTCSAQSLRRGSRIGERPKTQRDVDTVAHQILMAIVHQQVDMQVRMTLHEIRHARDDFPHAKAGRQCDTQDTAKLTGSACGVIGLFQCRQHRLDAHQIVLPRVRQRHGARGARKQRHPHLALQLSDDARRRWLGETKFPARTRKASRPSHADDKAESEQAVTHTDDNISSSRARGLLPLVRMDDLERDATRRRTLPGESIMSLQDKLDAFKADFEGKQVPPAVAAILQTATAELVASRQTEQSVKVGDRAPSFNLPDAEGNMIDSAKLLARGPLVLTFYRGVWCPYCNLDLRAIEAVAAEIRALGASL